MPDMLSRPKGSIKKVMYGEDGHVYYVIAAEGQKVLMGIQYLERFEDLNRHIGEPGLFFVRDAAAKHTDPNDYASPIIQNGDPTVHEGWAMYSWDTHKTNTSAGWRKVAEQESVDGPWGIDERILKMLVRRTEFNSFVEQTNNKLSDLTEKVQRNEENINGLNQSVNELKTKAHSHDNKESVLDKLTTVGGQLLFDGVAISGNTFLYNNIVDGSIVWKDPTAGDDAESTVCATAKDAANKFVLCSMATPGMVLSVAEPNGSITNFDIIKPVDSEALVAINKDNAVANGVGHVTYVTKLDTSGTSYAGRGIFCPIEDDGEYDPLELYEFIDGAWVSIKYKNGSGTFIDFAGAMFTMCVDDADPEMPYKRIYIFWNDNTTFKIADPNGVVYSFKETRLVRKFGSVPKTPDDGVTLSVSTKATDGSRGYTDVVHFSNEPVYYQLFTITKSGAICKPYDAAGITPKALEWKDLIGLIDDSVNARRLRERLFPIGTNVVLPEHPKFGKLMGEVVESSGSKMTFITTESLDDLSYDDAVAMIASAFDGYSKYVVSQDGKVQEGKTYAYYDNGFKPLELDVGTEFAEGMVVYELNTDYPDGIFTSIELPSRSLLSKETLPKRRHLDQSTTYWCDDRSTSDGTSSSVSGCAVMFTIAK